VSVGPTEPRRESVWTIGHSTRSLDEFTGLLEAHRIEAIADVRRFPGSRRSPQFDAARLAGALDRLNLCYYWLPELGGRRVPQSDSPNDGWRSAGFRGYADYMATAPFAEGFHQLVNLACGLRTAVMCAEAVWWRCHRGLLADLLQWLGFEVYHILSPGTALLHPYTAAAGVLNGRLSYSTRARPLRARGGLIGPPP
jgi:uncharacterized protein (DUF488 family)